MKNIFIVASCFAAITCFSACDDWTEVENVNINTPGIEEQDPAAYAKYLQNLVAYKNSDHKVVYAWFDNSEKTPFSRGQHISDAPDSLDVISMMYPAELAAFELVDMQTVHAKGTKVVYTISFDKIQKNILKSKGRYGNRIFRYLSEVRNGQTDWLCREFRWYDY